MHGVKASGAQTKRDYDFSISHDELTRTYKVHTPPSYDGKTPAPAVLNFHGGGGNADSARLSSGMNDFADKKGFIVVYPEAVMQGYYKKRLRKQYWNAGNRADTSKNSSADDVGFVSAMLDKLEKDFKIDSKRIYAAGLSCGGLMSYRLACQLSDRIAAIAPIEADQLDIECAPPRAMSIIHFHGLKDKLLPYAGGRGKAADTMEDWKPVPKLIAEWVKRNTCAPEPKTTFKHGSAVCNTYSNCKDGSEITLCAIEDHGHTWPDGTYNDAPSCVDNPEGWGCRIWKRLLGPINRNISANEEMWKFFLRHPKN